MEIFGYDNISGNIDLARQNSRRILIHNYTQFKKAELSDFCPEKPGIIIINPPYGERLGESNDLDKLYREMGDILKNNCQDSNAFILSGNSNLTKHIGLKSDKKIPLKNGKIDCRLLHFPIH